MKKMRKLLAVILAISMIAVLFVAMPASAATLTDPQKLAAMNLFRGDTTEGLTPQYLAKTPDRKTAARLLLRFTGLEEASDLYTGVLTFKDATTTTVYWLPMIGYLRANPSAGFQGYEDNTFRPNDAMNAQAFYKVLLTILGYKQDVDFTWDQTLTFAASKGLLKIANKTSLTNADAATAMVEALNANTKAGQKLVTKLIADGVVTKTQASAAGFNVIQTVTGYDAAYTMAYGGTNPLPSTLTAIYADNTTSSVAVVWSSFSTTIEGTYNVTGTVEGFGTITSKVTLTKTLIVTDAYPSGIREITVTFNMAVPTSTAVTVKSGLSVLQNLTQTWSADGKTLKITRTWDFTAGDYSVTVAGTEKLFKFENVKLTEINIGANNVYPQVGNQDLNVTFYNQYGTAMNPLLMNLQHTASCLQKGTIVLTVNKTPTSLTISGVEQLAVGDTIMLLVADNATAEVVTKVIAVAAAPVISSFSFGTLTIANNVTSIMTGTHGHRLSVYSVDQYGNPYKLRTGNQDISTTISANVPLWIRSSNSTIIDPAYIEVDANGDLFFKPGAISATKGGTVILTVSSPLNPNGMQEATFSISVFEPAQISKISIQGLASSMRAGQWTPLIAYVYDQYNAFIAMENINTPANLAKLTLISSNPTAIPSGNAGTSTGIRYNSVSKGLEVFGSAAGTSTVMIFYDNVLQINLQLNVEAAAAPSQLQSVSVPGVFQKTASANLTLDDFAIFDQYDASIKLQSGYYITVAGAGLNISNSTITTTMSTTTISAPTTGTFNLEFILKDPSHNALSSQSMIIEVVDIAGIVSYQIDPITNMYAKASSVTTPKDYYKEINVTGRTATGKSVQLVYNPTTGLPTAIGLITTTNSSFGFDVDSITGRLYLTTNYTGTTSSISTVIKIFAGGSEVASTSVTASSVAPYMYNVYFNKANETLAISSGVTKNFSTYLEAKDQYGVNYSLTSAGMYYMTTNSAVVSVNSSVGTFTLLTPGTSTVKAYFPSQDKTIEMVITVIN